MIVGFLSGGFPEDGFQLFSHEPSDISLRLPESTVGLMHVVL